MDDDDDEYREPCEACGFTDCRCDECPECNGTGWIPLWDGYRQYIGDGTKTCERCCGQGRV